MITVAYFVLHVNEKVFKNKYKLYLSIEDELKVKIKIQKMMIYLWQAVKRIIWFVFERKE